MARNRQPIGLIQAKGKKHLTKDEIKHRKDTEIQAPSDNIQAPSYLPVELQQEFYEIAKELIRINIMSNLDIDSLARFIISKKLYIDITEKILKNTCLITDKDIINSQDKLFKQCRQSASDLGLTISSRCKLVVPKVEQENKENKFAKFGVNNG
ncbi:TPA: phage terminase small subunit P27 family [Clostridioides difficile]|uniref:Phage terminase small subunit P27 family n=2 Tax=Clostridioides difficile TaxID=1496 RepID=A0AAN5VNW0_CLODI|nr:phage terminase small subunit P27 family [Clostridioides difficile]MCC0667620.1 phage terminase small subunit P27 family [Clostridioides sp. ZZV14-6153]MCC0738412.1 phage terminase small subunit P27 family [Clostridioides sp. ZZV14-5902]AUA29368.1 phage terminase small subunit P27 family [Clostridioides difficile]EGT3831891.1 phage terminase small subunit P27 family [Clostridioides difficile]EGT4017622.1 phage terminase small subunit P27 family [Clostridioides difficile]